MRAALVIGRTTANLQVIQVAQPHSASAAMQKPTCVHGRSLGARSGRTHSEMRVPIARVPVPAVTQPEIAVPRF